MLGSDPLIKTRFSRGFWLVEVTKVEVEVEVVLVSLLSPSLTCKALSLRRVKQLSSKCTEHSALYSVSTKSGL